MTERTAEKAQHPTPPGPPSPPTHEHPDGARCMWVRHNFIDRWRRVSATGWDEGPCPGLAPRHVGGCNIRCDGDIHFLAAEDVWDDSVAPGGYVCAECGMPTESEPCAEHQPEAVTE